MNVAEKALQIAKKAHEGQKRKFGNKEDYINHPIRVAGLVELGTSYPDDVYLATALLHDVIEDCYPTFEEGHYELMKDLENFEWGMLVVNAVSALTKREGMNYFDFIQNLLDDERGSKKVARKVKIADIKDNMSDLKEGSLKDKYRFALHLLETHQ